MFYAARVVAAIFHFGARTEEHCSSIIVSRRFSFRLVRLYLLFFIINFSY